jgi:hypothetical protein
VSAVSMPTAYQPAHVSAAPVRRKITTFKTPQIGQLPNYRPGDVVQFSKKVGCFKGGERATVVATHQGTVWVQGPAQSQPVSFPLQRAENFEVYQQGQVQVAAGDTIRLTANGTTHDKRQRLNNGSFHRVEGFTKEGHIRLEGGKVISREYAHLSHGYTTTSHGSQGATVDRVLVAQSSMSWGASSKEQLYVSVSRGRESVTIFTDSKEELRAAVRRSSERLSATEMMGQDRANASQQTGTGSVQQPRFFEPQKNADKQEKTATIPGPSRKPEIHRSKPNWYERLQQLRRKVLERTYARQRDTERGAGPGTQDRSQGIGRDMNQSREGGR